MILGQKVSLTLTLKHIFCEKPLFSSASRSLYIRHLMTFEIWERVLIVNSMMCSRLRRVWCLTCSGFIWLLILNTSWEIKGWKCCNQIISGEVRCQKKGHCGAQCHLNPDVRPISFLVCLFTIVELLCRTLSARPYESHEHILTLSPRLWLTVSVL